MNYRSVILVLVPVIVAGWWFLRDNPEAEIRAAHADLLRLVTKGEEDAEISILDIRALQKLFSQSCTVSGDAEPVTGTWSAEEIVGQIIAIRGLFQNIELDFSELQIEFPAANEAAISFSAELFGRSAIAGEEDVNEVRDVVSRMHELDGDWQFSAFAFTTTQP